MTVTEQRGDRTTQRAVLSFLLAEFPARHTRTTLWWMGFGDMDALEDAIRMLERFGLIRQESRAVKLTDAARHFDWLDLA